jgi:hypothetical protein
LCGSPSESRRDDWLTRGQAKPHPLKAEFGRIAAAYQHRTLEQAWRGFARAGNFAAFGVLT